MYSFFTDEKRFTIMTWWGKTLPVSKWVRNVVAELTKKVPAEALELWYIVLMRRMEVLSKPKRFIVVVLYWFTQNLNRDLHFWGLPQPLFSLMGLISTLQFLKAGTMNFLFIVWTIKYRGITKYLLCVQYQKTGACWRFQPYWKSFATLGKVWSTNDPIDSRQ